MSSSALSLPGLKAKLAEIREALTGGKAARIAYHVWRATKKFVVGSGNAAWVLGTSMLVMVMPLAFEIEREQTAGGMEFQAAAP
jgi:hypothetical protein